MLKKFKIKELLFCKLITFVYSNTTEFVYSLCKLKSLVAEYIKVGETSNFV